MKITRIKVKKFWEYMQKKYSFKVVNSHSNRTEMKIIEFALQRIGFDDFSDFLKDASITVPLGTFKSVYVPFDIGDGNMSMLQRQIRTCVHECQHLAQASRDQWFVWKYLSSDTHRAHYEADAYRTDMEMHLFLTGKLLSPKKLADLLDSYSIGLADRKIAERHLIISSYHIAKGFVSTSTTKTAIAWWKKYGG